MDNTQLLFETIIGSQAYGTAVEGSDIDMKGVYAQHPEDLMAFGYKEQYHKSPDEEYFEVRRFLQLAQSANPTVIELLWMPEDCVQHVHPAFQHIIDNRDMFLTKKCKHSFTGYAIQQIKKARGLDKMMNWEKERFERKGVLDFCHIYRVDGKSQKLGEWLTDHNLTPELCGLANIPNFRDCFKLHYDYEAKLDFKGIDNKNGNVALSNIPKGHNHLGLVHFNKDALTQHVKDYKSYQTWLKERNTQRYVDVKNHGQKIDGKNMLHCMRLIGEAQEIARDKTINIRRPDADYLISIRKGQVDLEEILQQAEEGVKIMDQAFDESDLPLDVDPKAVDQLLREVRRRIEWT